MSIESTSSSAFARRKTLTSALSQSDHYPYTRQSLKERQHSLSRSRTMSVSEDTAEDTLTDLSSKPSVPNKELFGKRDRRFSELNSSHPVSQNQGAHTDRRKSVHQINISSILPYPFRSNRHPYKNTSKDETNTSLTTLNNDMMAMKIEPPSSLKLSSTPTYGSRTNLAFGNDRPTSFIHEDSSSSISSALSSLFILDTSSAEPRSAETFILELHTPLCVAEIYRESFFDYYHVNYCGEFEQEGAFILSLRYLTMKSILGDNAVSGVDGHTYIQARAITRTGSGNHDVSVVVDGTNEDNILQILFNKAQLSAIHTLKTIGDPKANEKIYLFDKSNDERQNCKIGLIYQRLDQTDEYADRVSLKGFNKYRGDLDIKDDLQGEYSYYTQYQNHEIMFNIAPLIPSTKANGQCIERKGLVGNSFVCIVFQEADTEFLPDYISGKVTQVYITVQPMKIDEKLYYKVGVWHRNDVTSIIDPPGGIYRSDESFRDYFLTLLLNSINVAIESPSLRFRVAEQRQRIKQEELRKLAQHLSLGQNFDSISDTENISFQSDQSISSIKQSTTENMALNQGRTSPAPVKRRTISRILGVLTGGRSNSVSAPTPPSPMSNGIPLGNQPSPDFSTGETRTGSSAGRDPMRRAASVKIHAAPPPPISPRVPLSETKSVECTPSPIPPLVLSHSYLSHPQATTSDKAMPSFSLLPQNNLLNTNAIEQTANMRSRSNSSPTATGNTTTRLQPPAVSRISEEINVESSASADISDGNYSEDEKLEHRSTLTEPPLS